METLASASALPFEIGALYSRKHDIHARYGGQAQPLRPTSILHCAFQSASDYKTLGRPAG
jgi:hypothetical protein